MFSGFLKDSHDKDVPNNIPELFRDALFSPAAMKVPTKKRKT